MGKKATISCFYETHFSFKKTHKLKMKVWKKVFQENGSQEKKKSRGSYTYIRQNRISAKDCNKRQRRSLIKEVMFFDKIMKTENVLLN